MAELLLEILSEEIPARMQRRAADDLKRLVTDKLKDAGLEFTSAGAYVTPRRLALVVEGLPVETEAVSEEKRGPKVGAPDQAIEGFCRGNGVTPDQLEKRDVKGGEYYFAVVETPGAATSETLPSLLATAMEALPWPKSMRWGSGSDRWVRPVHGLLAVFEGAALQLSLVGTTASAETVGHRFLAPGSITVTSFADYVAKLEAAKVLLDPSARRTKIAEDAAALAKAAGLTVKPDDALLDEVTGLVEWPVPLMGSIDAEFLDLPPEVMTTAMRSHQKYFSLLDADGKFAPKFITVANRTTKDDGAAVTAGNERVLRARLADARFYWDLDRKIPLRGFVADLEDLVFHEKLGNLADKVWRMEVLTAELSESIPGADRTQAVDAARLCKADLTSGMVGEFPELQGIMGRYYAIKDNEPESVADAIADHYAPQGPSDACPTAPISVAVALADKIDTLVGFWGIDEKPTGSRDPFALRRAALGVIRLVLENELRLPLRPAFEAACAAHRQKGATSFDADAEELSGDLMSFFEDRLKVYLRDQGVRHDLISAVFALGDEDDLVRLLARVRALETFLGTDDGANLLTAYKRAANIVRIEQKNDDAKYEGEAAQDILSEPQEKTLFENLILTTDAARPEIEAERFDHAMEKFAGLRASVDEFFDHVTVNCDDAAVRVNRLKLLSQIRATLNQVADFSQIEGGER